MARLPELVRDELTPRQRETYDRIASGPREGVRGPFEAWVLVPQFADRAEAVGRYCRFENGLPKRLNELAILLVVRHWNAPFAWRGHLALAKEAGLPDDFIEAIRVGAHPSTDDVAERAVCNFVGQLLETRTVDDDAWSAATDILGDAGVVDLIGLTGYYAMVAMTLTACRIGADDGERSTFG